MPAIPTFYEKTTYNLAVYEKSFFISEAGAQVLTAVPANKNLRCVIDANLQLDNAFTEITRYVKKNNDLYITDNVFYARGGDIGVGSGWISKFTVYDSASKKEIRLSNILLIKDNNVCFVTQRTIDKNPAIAGLKDEKGQYPNL